MNIVFGPINSRRFGMSLGIDLSPNKKSCNFDCVYCELKGAKPTNFIKDPPNVDEIITQVKNALKTHQNIDVITLTANGEPTLYPQLETLVDRLNEIKTTQKLLILSNGTGVLNPKICDALKKIDIVKLSLDSVIQSTFNKIDRHKSDIKVANLVEAMAKFRENFSGELVLEILVVAGFNDTKDEFIALNEAINFIKPNRVDISTIDRPPAYIVKAVDLGLLKSLSELIISTPTLIAKPHKSQNVYEFSKDEILSTLKRRPQSEANVSENFSQKSKAYLNELLKDGLVAECLVAGVKFYKVAK
ncbi:radical SAM protein [Campylobacter mucosalis]|uniref:radical SAM protein n=1 Tax=Campylobacter mucosalis TaxID=202 RepID=UPI0020168257|nr:radical SAM protein [Campylobacter mucosalis]